MKIWSIRYINPDTGKEDGGFECDLDYLEHQLSRQIGDTDQAIAIVFRKPEPRGPR